MKPARGALDHAALAHEHTLCNRGEYLVSQDAFRVVLHGTWRRRESGLNVMRYETGAEEITAAKLYAFAKVFDVPIAAFFTDNAAPARAMVNRRKKVRMF